ncbi:Right handed beta helix region [Pedobacter steynii]|uniref:Right handed beta helix region n=1 Tax=Pedobacter steynii TaxID=430522 RepID=A0A1G9WJY6_9SPHI|nr:hypothetical protein [Pedobacter steynii]NQX40319.1 hypothetical protein [Pedobacter steynii]SDM84800.1 Right handed beta helix region [Pedobacter steynii]
MQAILNLNELRNYSYFPENIYLQGHSTVGDGGEGVFYWDHLSLENDNNGIIIKVTGVSEGRWKRLFDGQANVKWFGVKADGMDDTIALQNAIDCWNVIYLPKGEYKITSSIVLKPRSYVYGSQVTATIVNAYGCDAFLVDGNDGDNITIEKIQIRGYSSAGIGDPKTFTGIKSRGESEHHVNYLNIKDIFLIGFLYCIDLQFTWNSLIDNVETMNCANSVRVFGQTVNNSINNSRLTANGGNASILTQSDGVVTGEGLMINNTLMASGAYGVKVEGSFLSLLISNSLIDLISNIGVYFTDAKSTLISNTWIYATNRGIELAPLSEVVDQNISISNCRIQATAENGSCIKINELNRGVLISGGSLVCSSGGRCVHTYYARAIAIGTLFLVNPSTTIDSILVESSIDVLTSMLVGNATIEII